MHEQQRHDQALRDLRVERARLSVCHGQVGFGRGASPRALEQTSHAQCGILNPPQGLIETKHALVASADLKVDLDATERAQAFDGVVDERRRYPPLAMRGRHAEVIEPSPHAVVSRYHCTDDVGAVDRHPEQLTVAIELAGDHGARVVARRIIGKHLRPQTRYAILVVGSEGSHVNH